MTQVDWRDKRVTVVSCAALGDVTIYLYLAWLFHLAGARVRFVSKALFPARAYFDWLQVESSESIALDVLAESSDLVISYVSWLTQDAERMHRLLEHNNIAFVTAKKLSARLGIDGRAVRVGDCTLQGASRALCLDSRSGLNMVQWIDEYASGVYGLNVRAPMRVPRLVNCPDSRRRVAIFPTTPHLKKNYAPSGFRWLARRLIAKGWLVEFVGMPHEHAALTQTYCGFPVHKFADIRELMDFLSTCSVVVSNDSGGGHLGSLMGLRSFTVTRKQANFVWRPGFNELNQVLAPLMSFKLLGRYVWRPFVPLWRITARLGGAR
ncbi:MAG: hypothetical protein K2X65_10300 [Burkholderiaceae bacterium]|nr:hypothetical protein [Burkholderiaceae bacterium]